MCPTLRTCAIGAFCTLLAFVVIPASFAQNEESSGEGKAGTIFIDACRIMLPKSVRLAADRPGIVAFVEPEEGDKVQANQRIAGLRDEVPKANVDIQKRMAEIDIEVRFAKAAHDVDKKDLERAEKANKRHPNTVTEMEVQKMELAQIKSGLQIQKAEQDQEINRLKWQQAEAEWKTFQVEAPFDGTVTRVLKQRGEAVRQGDAIIEIVNTERVRVEGEVDIKDVFAIKPGARVTVKLSVPNYDLPVEKQTFEGRIGFVDVTVVPGTEKVRLWAEVANHDNLLRGGLLAEMTIDPNDVVEPEKKEISGADSIEKKSAAALYGK